jgi:hypothetical protein
MAIEHIDYRKLVTGIQKEIESLEIHQEDTTRRLARLKQSLMGLAPLAEEQDADENRAIRGLAEGGLSGFGVEEISMTDSARQILQASDRPLSPVEIKDRLIGMGKSMDGHKNVMASVHSLLKRLVASGDIESKDSGLTYEWKGIRRFPRTDIKAGIGVPRRDESVFKGPGTYIRRKDK